MKEFATLLASRRRAIATGAHGGADAPVFAHDDAGKVISVEFTLYRFTGDDRHRDRVSFVTSLLMCEALELVVDADERALAERAPHLWLSRRVEAFALDAAFPDNPEDADHA